MIRPPRLRTTESDSTERRASWLELFFDLVFVVGIAELSHLLVEDHSLAGFGIFAGLFLPVYIAWQGYSFYADRFDTDDLVFRGALLAAMLAISAMAIQVGDVAHGTGSTGFVVAYVVVRGILVALYARAWRHVPEGRPIITRYGLGYTAGIGLWLVSLLFDEPGRYIVWGISLAWEYALPTLSLPVQARVPVSTSHVPERFGLFTIIVLGESIVVVAGSLADTDWNPAAVIVAALGFGIAAAIWWTYFGLRPRSQIRSETGRILIYAHVHIPMLAALTAVAAGVELAVTQAAAGQGAVADPGARWALCGGIALYLACLTVIDSVGSDPPTRGHLAVRLAIIAFLVLLAATGLGLSAALVPAAVLAGMVLMLAVEARAADR